MSHMSVSITVYVLSTRVVATTVATAATRSVYKWECHVLVSLLFYEYVCC